MPDKKDQSLEDRLEHLEQLVEKLQYTIERMQDRIGSTTSPRPPLQRTNRKQSFPASTPGNSSAGNKGKTPDHEPEVPDSAQLRSTVKTRPMYDLNGQAWLNRIGIGLLFLAVAFALKLTFDQPWFTATLRIMAGSFVGLLLLALGLHFHHRRRRFGQLLLGGGFATFYLTAFASYQLYQLLPPWVAFSGMLLITILSFPLAAKRNDAILAILATLGGLATPFLLPSSEDYLLVLVIYSSLILIGAGIMYYFRGWRSLLFVSFFGACFVNLFCYVFFLGDQAEFASRWTLQISVLLTWLLFWVMPVIRGMLRAYEPEKWPAPPPVRFVGYFFNHPALPLSVSTPLFTLIMSMLIWKNLSNDLWGWVALLASSIYGFLYLYIRGKDRKDLSHLALMQGLTSSIFLTVGLFLLYNGHNLLIALAVEALLIRFVARSMDDRLFSIASHALFAFLYAWIFDRFVNLPTIGTPFLNAPAISELVVLILGAAVGRMQKSRRLSLVYLFISHLFLLGWFFREPLALSNGQALITTLWGIYGVVLFLWAMRNNNTWLRFAAFSTLALVVLKLFLVDLDEVEPLIRILLFLGFGIVFMMLSYILPSVFKKQPESPAVQHAAPEKEEEPTL